jgi:hypothetical protein
MKSLSLPDPFREKPCQVGVILQMNDRSLCGGLSPISTNFDVGSRVISAIYDTALAPDSWPEALRQVTQALGAVGAAYILTNKWSGLVEWASFSGPSVEFKPERVLT